MESKRDPFFLNVSHFGDERNQNPVVSWRHFKQNDFKQNDSMKTTTATMVMMMMMTTTTTTTTMMMMMMMLMMMIMMIMMIKDDDDLPSTLPAMTSASLKRSPMSVSSVVRFKHSFIACIASLSLFSARKHLNWFINP